LKKQVPFHIELKNVTTMLFKNHTDSIAFSKKF
jgi:hypothetical protein